MIVRKNQEIIYISVNNWFCGRDYPSIGFFKEHYDSSVDGWSNIFTDEYCKENKLCVIFTPYDMSTNLTISAPRKWVEDNCPELFNIDAYLHFLYAGPGKDHLGCIIPEYIEDNIGVKWEDDPVYLDDEDDEDD